MIFLISLVIFATWATAAVMISKKIPRWLGFAKNMPLISIMTFPIIFLTPALQDIVGLWQFEKLCKNNDLIYVSSDWRNVNRAIAGSTSPKELNGNWIAIREWPVTYLDSDTGLVFFSYKGFTTNFGWLGNIVSLGNSKTCDPVNLNKIQQQLKIDELIKEGKKP